MLLLCAISRPLLSPCPAIAQADEHPQAHEQPWWDQEKIRFFWGPWMYFYEYASANRMGDVNPVSDEQLMRSLAAIGATVFADKSDWSLDRYYGDTVATRKNRARLAREWGIRYFAHLHSAYFPYKAEELGARLAVNKDGKTSKEDARGKGTHVPCPLDENAVDRWLFDSAIDMANSGVVDGCIIDWEMNIHGFSEMEDDLCYCGDCFGKYMQKKGLQQELASKERYNWLNKQSLLAEYLDFEQQRLITLYRQGAERVRAVKPDFVFAAYQGFMPGHFGNQWKIEAAAHGLHSRQAPYFVVDSMHYNPNHAAPWWESGYVQFKELGMKFILGSYTRGIMGGIPEMDVSAVQWIYDAAINTDGFWVWFEHKWGPLEYAAFRTADKRIRDVENKVGKFLFKGTQDAAFVTVVEQSGDPVLGRNIITRTYHLGDRHLVHVNNVNSYRPLEVLVRFPRFETEGTWAVTDSMSDVRYTHGVRNALWFKGDLEKGVLLSMEKRSDAWLLITPQSGLIETARLQTVSGDTIKGHPDRPATAASVSAGKPVQTGFPLVFARKGPLGYSGAHQPVLGTSIFFIDAAGGSDGKDRQLFAIKGNCWSPTLSPDRTKVVFSSYVNGKGQIYVVNADATVKTGPPGAIQLNEPYMDTTWTKIRSHGLVSFEFKAEGVNLSNNDFCEHSPVWSPDGAQLAFVSDRDGDWEIYVMTADGGGLRRITHSPGIDRAPAWSPKGNQIAYESNRNGDFDIYLIDSDGTDESALVKRSGNDLEPRWSPDGARIACISNQHGFKKDIILVDPKTGDLVHPKGLTRKTTSWWRYDRLRDIRWSPNSLFIAAAFEDTDSGRYGIVVVGADGNDLNDLVTAPVRKPHPGGTDRPLVGGWYFDGSASHPFVVPTFRDLAWSANSETIAFRSDMDPSGYEFFFTVPATGGNVTRFTNTLSPMGLKNKPVPLNAAAGPKETAPSQ
jgi:hypothetical protein